MTPTRSETWESRLAEPTARAFWIGLCLLALLAPLQFIDGRFLNPDHQIRIRYIAPASGSSQMFYSTDGVWKASEVVGSPTLLGFNDALYQIPAETTESVRWDPAGAMGRYEVLSVQLLYRGQTRDIPLEALTLAPGRFAGDSPMVEGGRLVVFATHEDPQITIDLTHLNLARRSFPSGPVVAIVLVLIAFALHRAWKWKVMNADRSAIAIIALLYVGFFGVMAESVPRLPFRDDWRYVAEMDSSGRLPITVGWLFSAHNDTVYATPKLLDALILNATKFSFYALHVVGLVLLGVFLALATALLRRLSARVAPTSGATATLTLALALAAPSYWPRQAVSYHHMLPIVLGLGMLLLVDRHNVSRLRIAGAAAIGLLAGFGYVSGALMVLAIGITLMLGLVCRPEHNTRDRQLAGVVLAVGVVATVTQLLLISRDQGSVLISSAIAPIAMPWSIEFWGFASGIVIRAIAKPNLPALLALAAAAMLAATPLLMVRRLRSASQQLELRDIRLVLFGGVMASIYVAMISAGRGKGLGESVALNELIAFGSSRFHFWWVSALLPFMWLGWTITRPPLPSRIRRGLFMILTVVLIAPASLGPWRYESVVTPWVALFDRVEGCFISHHASADTLYECGEGPEDMAALYDRAVELDLVFLRQGERVSSP